jgi:mono/diheme cytochrome c family protein
MVVAFDDRQLSNPKDRTMTPDIKRVLVPLDFSTSAPGTARKLTFASAAMLAALLLTPLAASAQDQPMKQTTTGGEVFKTYCATCHGTSARGDGPLSSSMRVKPPNLTEIAKRNGGVYPSELVFRTIDGRSPVRGHGGPDMPVWGDAFSRSREAGDADRVKAVIRSLVDYLESVQLRPAHEP